MVQTQTKEQVAHQLDAYFHDAESHLNIYEITLVGNLIDLEITYYDFKPIKEVRRDLDAMFPNLNALSISRAFSHDAIGEFIYDNLDTVVRTTEGTEMPVYDFIENTMYDKKLKQEVAV